MFLALWVSELLSSFLFIGREFFIFLQDIMQLLLHIFLERECFQELRESNQNKI